MTRPYWLSDVSVEILKIVHVSDVYIHIAEFKRKVRYSRKNKEHSVGYYTILNDHPLTPDEIIDFMSINPDLNLNQGSVNIGQIHHLKLTSLKRAELRLGQMVKLLITNPQLKIVRNERLHV